MYARCHSCAQRFIGGCNANCETFERKRISECVCPEYKQVVFADVVTDKEIETERKYRIISNLSHIYMETLPARKAKEKYGKYEWRGAYSTYSAVDVWLAIPSEVEMEFRKENK